MTTGEAPPAPPSAAGDPPPAPVAADHPPAASIKRRAIRGVGWTSFIHAYRIGMGLVTTWVLAILLGREAFGLVGGAAVMVGILLLLKDLGAGPAIVQRRDLPETVLASLFWANLILGAAGTLALFTAAPVVAWLMAEPELEPILRVLSISLLFAGMGVTHQSLLQRDLRFARLAKIETLAITVGAGTGITVAFLGGGVWALVSQSLVTMGITSVLAILLQGYRPARRLRWEDVRGVARFSLNLTGFNILNCLTRGADQLLVLRVLGQSEAGLYYLSIKLLLFPTSSINSVLSRVLFPLFSTIQDDDQRLRNAFLKVTATIAMVVLPFLVGFVVLADPIVRSVLPPEWLPVIPLATALTVVALAHSLSTSVGNLFLAKGRTDLLCLIGLVMFVASLVAYSIGVCFGTVGVARAYAALAALTFAPVMVVSLRLIQTPFRDFLSAVWRPAAAAAGMGLAVWGLGGLLPEGRTPIQDLAIRIPVGIAVYVWLIFRIHGDHSREVLGLVRSKGL